MIFFLLPALNESECIETTLRGIHLQMEKIKKKYQIIVCDNGSADNTPQISKENNAVVTYQPIKGYGHTLMKGIEYIQSEFLNIPDKEKIIIFMDADGQDSQENISVHLQNLKTTDFSIASRINPQIVTGNAASVFHTLANKLFGLLLWIRTGKKFYDLGPFRAMRMNTFLSLSMSEFTYGWTAEMQKKIAQKNISYIEFYSAPKIRVAGQSKVSGSALWKQLKIGLQIIWVILK